MKQLTVAEVCSVNGASITDIVATTIGSGLGGIAGTFLGGPVGGAVGAGVGAGIGASIAGPIDQGIHAAAKAVRGNQAIRQGMVIGDFMLKTIFG